MEHDLNQHKETLIHLKQISNALDTKFEAPGGFRFGFDGLLGLIPMVGDFVTSAISLYIIAQAALMGVGPSTLIRMALNVGVENLFDMIPLIGNFFDFYWKSNSRNMVLLERHLNNPVRETIKSRMVVTLICFVLLALLILSAYITFVLMQGLLTWILELMGK
jgi:hypothetical protein